MQSKPELEVIVPEWNAPENIKAFFTLRSGGMSACAYGDKDGFCGLNLGNHVGDNKYSVRGNRRIVTDMLGAEPKWLSQVHSSRVVRAEDNNAEEQADAEFTTAAGIPCVVMTADCVPVLLCEQKRNRIAAAHAGWKGLADGVLQKPTVAADEEKKSVMKPKSSLGSDRISAKIISKCGTTSQTTTEHLLLKPQPTMHWNRSERASGTWI